MHAIAVMTTAEMRSWQTIARKKCIEVMPSGRRVAAKNVEHSHSVLGGTRARTHEDGVSNTLYEEQRDGYYGHMKEAQISEVKNQLSRYLALVRKGEIVRILDRRRAVAQIIPITHAVAGRAVGTEALAEMERKGLIRRGTGRVARKILDTDPPGRPAGVLDALLEERQAR